MKLLKERLKPLAPEKEPLGLELEQVKVKDRILAKINGIQCEIEILAHVHYLTDWLYHVLVITEGRRENDSSTFYAVYDDASGELIHKNKIRYLELIKTIN